MQNLKTLTEMIKTVGSPCIALSSFCSPYCAFPHNTVFCFLPLSPIFPFVHFCCHSPLHINATDSQAHGPYCDEWSPPGKLSFTFLPRSILRDSYHPSCSGVLRRKRWILSESPLPVSILNITRTHQNAWKTQETPFLGQHKKERKKKLLVCNIRWAWCKCHVLLHTKRPLQYVHAHYGEILLW